MAKWQKIAILVFGVWMVAAVIGAASSTSSPDAEPTTMDAEFAAKMVEARCDDGDADACEEVRFETGVAVLTHIKSLPVSEQCAFAKNLAASVYGNEPGPYRQPTPKEYVGAAQAEADGISGGAMAFVYSTKGCDF